MTESQLADIWIEELKEAGLSDNQMLKVFSLARYKFEKLKVKEYESKLNIEVVKTTLPNGDIKYRVHGHSSTTSKTKLEAINRYLKSKV